MKRSINFLTILMMFAMIFVACEQVTVTPTPDPEPEPEPDPVVLVTGTLKGAVRDAVSSDVLSGVKVEAFMNGESVASVTSGSDGSYEIELEIGTGYELHLSLEGYLNSVIQNLDVEEDITSILPSVPHIKTDFPGAGTIKGVIKDAFTGLPLAGATLKFRQNMNNRDGDIAATVTTEADGSFTANVQVGQYTIELSLSGHATEFFHAHCLGGQDTDGQGHSISPILNEGEVRIILNWGETPSDLDSHLTGPLEGTDRFHVYFDNKAPAGSNANLDVDDTNSFGPETITITESREGVYRYSVHNYSDKGATTSSTLAASGCHVRVINDEQEIEEFYVPNEAGTLWTVFEIDGDEIKTVNEMSYESTPENVRAARTDAALLQRLPMK